MASTEPPEMRHRIKVRVLVVLASVLAFLAIFTSWIDRQALDTDQWVHTSGKLLEDKEISDALATYAVDQLYANVDVSAVVKQRLPHDLQKFSAPASAGIRQVATQAAKQAIQSPARSAGLGRRKPNRPPRAGLDPEGQQRGRLLPERQGRAQPPAPRLQLADRIGLKKQPGATRSCHPTSGSWKSRTRSSSTRPAPRQDHRGARLALHDRHLRALRSRGLSGEGPALGGRARLRPRPGRRGARGDRPAELPKGLFVDSLSKTEAANVPAQHAWDIATSLLQSIATSVVIFGVLFVIASFLASPAGAAISIRQAFWPPPCATGRASSGRSSGRSRWSR